MAQVCPNPECERPIDESATRCPRCGTRFPDPPQRPLIAAHAPPTGAVDPAPRPGAVQYLEIDTGYWRRYLGWLAYGLFFLAVAAVLAVIFVRVSGSWRIAICVVGFMIGYMLLMGYVTGKGMRGDEDGPRLRR